MASSSVGELQISLKFDEKSLSASASSTQKTMNGVADAIDKRWSAMGAVIQHVAIQAFDMATGAAKNFLTSTIQVGAGFDTAMSQVAATMGTTVDQIDDLAATAMNMGATTAFTATQAAEGLNILAMAGLNAEQQIAGIPTVLNLASAGTLSLEQAASYAVGAVNGFSDSMDNAAYYADLMAKGATLANTDVGGLGAALGRSAATAASYGQKADSVTLSLVKLAAANVTGEEAATALNRAMADVYTPTKSAKEALDALGVSAYDAGGNARDFNDITTDLSKALSGMSAEEANAVKNTIFTTQGLNAFNKMASLSTEQVEGFKNGLNEASGSAAAQAATQLDNLEGKMTLFSSAVDGAKLSIYNNLKPALLSGADGLASFATAVQAALDGGDVTEAVTGFVTSFGAALRDGIVNLGTIAGQVLPVLLEAFVGIIPSLTEGLITGAVNVVLGIANALPSILMAIVNAVIGVINLLTSPDMLYIVLDAGIQLLMGLVEALPTVVQALANALPMIIDNITTFFIESLPIILEGAIELFMALIESLPTIIEALVGALPDIINSVVGFLTQPDTINMVLDAAITVFFALIDSLPTIIDALVSALPDVIASIVDFLTNPSTIVMLINAAVKLFFALVQAVPKILGALISAFGSLVGSLWNSIKVMFGKFAENFGSFITGAFKGAINGVLGFIEGFINSPIRLLNGFIDVINGAFGWVGVHLGKINLVSLPRMEYGGIVPGNDYSGDHNLIRANSGEMVITRSQQAALWDMIESGTYGDTDGSGDSIDNSSIDITNNYQINSNLDAEEVGDLVLESIRRAVI